MADKMKITALATCTSTMLDLGKSDCDMEIVCSTEHV